MVISKSGNSEHLNPYGEKIWTVIENPVPARGEVFCALEIPFMNTRG
jgi:hypothetical protein